MDKLFVNGTIRTLDDRNRVFEAIGVTNGKISYLGSNEEANKLHADERIDLHGALLLPGFNDTHMHMMNYVFCKRWLVLDGCKSVVSFLGLAADYIKQNSEKINKDGFVRGRGFNQENFAEKRYPTLSERDKLCPDHPFFASRICGHIALVNSKTLELVKTAEDFETLKDYVDFENGILNENAMGLFHQALHIDEKQTADELEADIQSGIAALNASGITSVGTNDYFGNDDLIHTFSKLESEDKLHAAVNLQCTLATPAELFEFIAKGHHRIKGAYFSTGPLKLFADGSIGARTAALNADYSDDPGNRGFLIYDQNELDTLTNIAHSEGIQIAVHAIGDKAMDMVLESYEKALDGSENKLRHGLVHAQVTSKVILERMRLNKIIAYIQPSFFEDDIPVIKSRIGSRIADSYAYKTMLDTGIPVVGGSDCPVTSFDVLENIWYAVTRKTMSGSKVFLPGQCLSIDEAVKLFTKFAAYSCFEENQRGTLEPGKMADFVVLGKDIYSIPSDEIKTTAVNMTVSGGRIVYKLG